jgi:hypothetical protein
MILQACGPLKTKKAKKPAVKQEAKETKKSASKSKAKGKTEAKKPQKTKKIKKYKWDDSLKLAEHTAFFFEHKGKLKIAHTKLFSVNHQQVRELEYTNYRNRAKHFFKEWMIRKGVNEVIDFNNRISYKIN